MGEKKEQKSDDDEINIDFSKIKNFFKRKEKIAAVKEEKTVEETRDVCSFEARADDILWFRNFCGKNFGGDLGIGLQVFRNLSDFSHPLVQNIIHQINDIELRLRGFEDMLIQMSTDVSKVLNPIKEHQLPKTQGSNLKKESI